MTTEVFPDAPSPAELGYRMPAEWEPHTAVWIAWPHERADWPERFEPIPWVYVEIVRKLHRFERARILALPTEQEQARAMLSRAGVDLSRVDFLPIATDRVWTRDYAGMVIRHDSGRRAVLDWHFNGWAKYDNWRNDDALPARVAQYLDLPRWVPRKHGKSIVLEGGSIDVNGAGLLLTTEECLLSSQQARNPGLTRREVEEFLCQFLGVQKVLWLNRGIVGDDTHGHIDDLARFVGPRRVVTVVDDDPGSVNYEALRENLERLRSMTDLDGSPLEVVTLPTPAPIIFDGQTLPASYANFYIANRCVLVPTFNDANDRRALAILAEVFSDREVIGIHAGDLVWGLGTLHCLTQQEPAGQ